MADEKISALPAPAALTGAELMPIVQAGGNFAAPLTSLFTVKSLVNLDLYVRVDGNDNNDGRANNAAGAFLTLARAFEEVCKFTVIPGIRIIIHLKTGVFSGSANLFGSLEGPGNITGAWTTPVLIDGDGAANTTVHGVLGGFLNSAIAVGDGARISLSNLKLTADGNSLVAFEGGIIELGLGLEFGTIASIGVSAYENGICYAYSDYVISGGGQRHMATWGRGYIEGGYNLVTLIGNPTFSIEFVYTDIGGLIILESVTYIGAGLGKRFFTGGIIDTGFSGLNYFPGNANGAFVSGGRYDDFALDSLPGTVAALPVASAALKGVRSFVTDATATVFLSVVAGGGANNVPVVCDGAAWRIG